MAAVKQWTVTIVLCLAVLSHLPTLSVGQAETITGYRLPDSQEFLVIASKTVRPEQIYELHVTITKLHYTDLTVRATLSRNNEEYASGHVIFYQEGTKPIQMEIPLTVSPGNHKLAIEGVVSTGIGKPVFRNETEITFETKYASLFVLTDRPLYSSPDKVQFRVVGVTQELKPMYGTLLIYIMDANNNIVRRWRQKQLNFGMFEAEFDITYPVATGTWHIQVEAFGHIYRQPFEVVMYYPNERPFEVNITTPLFLFNTEWGVAGTLYGEHVRSSQASIGNATIELTVQNEHGAVMEGKIVKTIGYVNGMSPFHFSMHEIMSNWKNVTGMYLHFKAWLYDWTFLATQNGTCVTKVVRDGVVLKILGKRLRSFKPGAPVTIYFAVTRTDGTHYMGFYNRQIYIQRVHEGGSSLPVTEDKMIVPDDGIVAYTFTPDINDAIINVRANHPETGSNVEVRLYRYFSKSGSYLSLSSSTNEPKTDDYMVVTIRTNFFVPQINFLISSGGRILLGSTVVMNAKQKTFAVAISRKMVPRARLVAYCVVDGEVILDSLNFYVDDARLTTASVVAEYGKDFSQDTIRLRVFGDAGAFVGISGVDYEWYRRGASTFLREQMVLQELMTYDDPYEGPFRHTWYYDDPRWEESVFFPAPTSGMDTVSTFEISGLVALSDMNMTVKQEYTPCNFTMGQGLCPNGQCYLLSKKCDGRIDCLDGYDEVSCPIPEEDRWRLRPPQIKDLHKMSRYFDKYYWAWQVTYLKHYGTSSVVMNVPPVTDSAVISAFVLHPEHGLSIVKQPTQHDTSRVFFIMAEAPAVIRRGEQVGIRVGIFNNWDQKIEAIIMLHGADTYRFVRVEDFGFVRSYNPRLVAGDIQTMVEMPAGEQKYIFMPVVPLMESGQMVVRISAYSPMRHDTKDIIIDVHYDGITCDDYTPYLLDLVNQGSQLIPDFNLVIPERIVEPGQRDLLYIPGSNVATVSMFGDLVMPGFFEPHLTMHITVGMPHDSADGYMFDYAINLQTLIYLQKINVLKQEDRENALEYMQSILMRQYAYMQPDGSYKMFRRDKNPCVWLTAFVLKTLQKTVASQWVEDVYIPIEILNKIALWLAAQQNSTTGAFHETADDYYNRNFWPWVKDTDGVIQEWHIPVTAHAVIALSQATRLTGLAETAAENAKQLGASYLAGKYSRISDPYQLAIATYALESAKHGEKDTAYNRLRAMNITHQQMYWASEEIPPNEVNIINTVPIMEPRGDFTNLENAVMATSYSLLLYLARNRVTESVPIMKWLVDQHNGDVAWASTQDTLLALEALTEFAFRETNRDFYRMQIQLEGTAVRWSDQVRLNQTNFANLYAFQMEHAFGEVRARAQGTGYAYIGMTAEKNVEKPYQVQDLGPDYKSYDVSVENIRYWGRNASSMAMTLCVGWARTDVAPESGMTFIIVGIPTGYVVTRDNMEEIYSANITGLRRVRFRDQTLIVFFNTLKPQPTCLTFRAERWYPVANISIGHELYVKQYAESGFSYESAYEAYTLFHLHICQVCGSFQCPYCPTYNKAPPPASVSSMATSIMAALLANLIWSFVCC